MKRSDDQDMARFEAWYKHDMRRLFNYVSYWVGDKMTAEELTAAICERALKCLHQYDPTKGTLDAWMFAIAGNMLRNHFQRMQRTPAFVALDDLPEIHAQGHSPEEVCEIAEAFRHITAHLPHLPEAERDMIALRYGAGLSNTEIARITGLTSNHVGVLMHRALKKLRQAVLSTEEV